MPCRHTPDMEIEIKLPVADLHGLRQRLLKDGFQPLYPRFHEMNLVFDTPGQHLSRTGRLLRLRRAGEHNHLTTKFPVPERANDRYKVRGERETEVGDFNATRAILEQCGFQVVFTYEKFREILAGKGVQVMLDETPIGRFMEIEGRPDDIDRLAGSLGFSPGDYITANYRSLFHAAGGGGDMRFPPAGNDDPED